MAADQRRKRINGASAAVFNSLKQYRMKKRKWESPKHGLSSKSHISLEWDGNQKKVVAKREQIGISRRSLRPFFDSVPGSHSVLADVISIPRGAFQLENLVEVLSYEAWQTQLSEDERHFLMQFLPSRQNAEEVVKALLSGDNLHFGNPFLKWGASLCSGNLHPDAVLHQEQCLKAEKKAYYLGLQKYHNDIIEYLQKLKDRWESCKDPENEILPKFWRSRRHFENKSFLNASESRFHDLEQDVTATSESCSWVADERACSSDNQNSSVMKGGELQKRVYEKGLKDKSRNQLITSDDVPNVGLKSKKGDKLNQHNIRHSDGAKYMSYFKISKKQHQLVKNMKQSGKSIQSKSLNRVLGNLEGLHVQPYEVFVEEEQKKLREHWLQLAIKDIPVFYAKWKERRFQMWEITECLGREMKQKVILSEVGCLGQEMEEKVSPSEDEGEEEPVIQDEMKEHPESSPQDQEDDMAVSHESSIEDDEESVRGSPQDQSPQLISSPGDSREFDQMDVDPENNHVTSKSGNSSSDESGHMGKMNTGDETVNEEVPLSSTGDVWPAINRSHSYYDSNASHEFTSSELPLMNPQVNKDQQAHMIDLESNLHEEDMRKDLLHRHSDDDSLSSYQNQDRNELLQSLFKDQGVLSYHQEQKHSGLDFQASNNLLMAGDGQFHGHFHEQLETSLPLEQGQKLNDFFMQQNISDNIYSDRGRYLVPRQENMQPGNVQNWTVNAVRVSEPLESHINGGDLVSHNWFPGEHQVRGGWTSSGGVSIQNQSIGNGSNADQSLFSVLSNCNQLRSISPYDPIGSTEQFIPSRHYGLVGGGAPGMSNALPHPAHPLDYLGGRDAAASVMPDDMGWINLPHQNQALHDQMGKPYF